MRILAPWDLPKYNESGSLSSFGAWTQWMLEQSDTTKLLLSLLSETHLEQLFEAFDDACRQKIHMLDTTEDVINTFGTPHNKYEELDDIIRSQLEGNQLGVVQVDDLPMDGPDSALDNTKTCILCKADITDEPEHKCELSKGKLISDSTKQKHAAWRAKMKPEFDAIQAAHNISPEAITRRIG